MNTNTNELQGQISFVANPSKGFGFIISEALQEPVFFHASQLRDIMFPDLRLGDRVAFKLGSNQKGRLCVDIRKIST